jgi:hypothetical protein
MRSATACRLLGALWIAVAVAASTPATAGEPSSAARADELFKRARSLMDELRYAEACPLLEESYQLDPAGGTLLNLALCHEATNRTKTAYDEYRLVLEKARADKRADRERVARDRMAGLEARVPAIIVRLAEQDRDATVLLDGVKIEAGTTVRLDPGRHELGVSAPGRRTWQTSFEAKPFERPTFDVPPLAADGEACAPGGSCAEVRGGSAPPTAPPPSAVGVPPAPQPARPAFVVTRTHANPWRIALLSVSAASLTASLATGIAAIAEHSKAGSDCIPARGFCATPGGISATDTARTLAWVSTLTLLGGIGTGLVGLLLMPAEVAGPSVGVAVGPAGVFLRGRM